MNKMSSGRIGLIADGCVKQSFLARIPAVLQRVGPFKSSSFQVSRRLVNGLRAGIAVADHRAFEGCDFVWIVMPEDKLDTTVDELARHVPLEQKMIVLCDVMRDSFRLSALRIAGARVASLNCLPASNERIFAAEGHPAVISQFAESTPGRWTKADRTPTRYEASVSLRCLRRHVCSPAVNRCCGREPPGQWILTCRGC
jgi:hypothetical protein